MFQRAQKSEVKPDSILEIEKRFRSGEIGDSEALYIDLYPNRWDLVNQLSKIPADGDIITENEISTGLRLIKSIETSAKLKIRFKINPKFDGVPPIDSLPVTKFSL